ncbi:homeobox protein ceh-30-like [Mytilus trossulus]|uniref:homeobox protein ceh-30-like n=1 Tax=Mytilus trossulus TaxID=6551 RepID=UPI003005635D
MTRVAHCQSVFKLQTTSILSNMAFKPNASAKMSFNIAELSKSSRVSDTVCTDAVVNNIHDLYLPSSSQSCTAEINLQLSYPTQYQRNRLDDLSHSSDTSFHYTDSTSRDCTSPGSCSDDSVKSDQQPKRARTIFTNSQLMELERYYSNSKYLQIEDRPKLAKKLKLSQHKIKWWFQNRRMKEKRHIKSTSLNSPRELSQFVGVGKPVPRMLTLGSNENISLQSYSTFPMLSPYMTGLSSFAYPGYVQQFYRS